jgi:fatty acid desaturase
VTLLERMLLGTNVALGVLQARLVLVLTLLLTAGAFAWAFWLQTQLACILAAAWAVLVFLPVLFSGDKPHAAQHRPASDSQNFPAGTPAREPRRRSGGNSVEERLDPRASEAQRELTL